MGKCLAPGHDFRIAKCFPLQLGLIETTITILSYNPHFLSFLSLSFSLHVHVAWLFGFWWPWSCPCM